MTMTQRVILAAVIILVDLVAFVAPLSAMLLAYAIVFKPSWFSDFGRYLEGP